jgi:hypothetical protein
MTADPAAERELTADPARWEPTSAADSAVMTIRFARLHGAQ